MCNMSTENNNNNNVTAKKGEEGAAGWGTLEELLLACAVRRHGTNSWDSIATEVRNRGSSNLRASFSSHNCRRKYAELRRRFDGDESEDGDRAAAVVDELRALRVAELRREVCRRDASIVSLQLKVKRLEEEGRRNGDGDRAAEKEEENGGPVAGPVDLGKDRVEGGDAAGEGRSSPEAVAWKSASAGSYESNSTNQKCEDLRTGEAEKKPERAETAGIQPEMVRDGSNGRGEAEKKSAAEGGGGGGGGESNELDESATESNRREEGGEGVKQSSDVHSAASLSRRPKRRRPPRSGAAVVSSSGEEPEAEEVSPASKPWSSSCAVKSQPLARILGIIRSHKNGSAFERRLRGQDTERDKMMMIRQPMDLETVQTRLRKGLYSDCTRRFFRDLLLIFNNAALIINRKNSPERAAALELRSLIIKQMAQAPSTAPAPTPNPQPGSLKPDPPDPYLINKQPAPSRTRPSPAAVTRKRVAASSSQAQAPPPPENTNKKLLEKRRAAAVSARLKLESPPPKRAVERRLNTAKKTGNREDKEKEKDKPLVSGKRSRRKSRSFISEESSSSSDDKEEEEDEDDENDDDSGSEAERLLPKADRKGGKVPAAKKRLGAADFLKRMKQNSPNEKSKFSTDSSNYSNNGEERRAATKDRSARRRAPAAAARREVTAPTLRNNNNNNNKVKRAVGRPPKKPGAASPSPAKRVRENGEGGSTGRATKRSRR